ncbi:MAG: LapA family protein [Candidatus Paceibacterota bacterium]|jgi:uncharacterized integral membrane protein
MLLFLILGLLIGALSVVFALQNVAVITVTFLIWQVTGSLAVVLLIAIVAGMIMSVLVSVPEVIKDQMKIRELNRRLAEKDTELEHYKKLANELNKSI